MDSAAELALAGGHDLHRCPVGFCVIHWYPARAGAGISGATDTIDRAAARAIETNDGNVKARRDIQIVTLIIFCVLLTFLPG